VYLADFKVADADLAARWLHAPDYPEAALHAIGEMGRQVGPLSLDERGVATRGLLVRLLVLPGAEEDAMRALDLLSRRLPGAAVNVMDQYRPLAEARRHPPLDRRPAPDAIGRVRARARDLGLRLIRAS
jgi:putative pyruvate formate lyase activating enzyme